MYVYQLLKVEAGGQTSAPFQVEVPSIETDLYFATGVWPPLPLQHLVAAVFWAVASLSHCSKVTTLHSVVNQVCVCQGSEENIVILAKSLI